MLSAGRPAPYPDPMPSLPPALTRELGQAAPGLDGMTTDLHETTAELQYPMNLAVYDQMRRSDPTVRTSLRAIKNPIQATPWSLSARGCRPVVVAHVAHELGLLRDHEGTYRTREGGVSWLELLRLILLQLDYGHSVGELLFEYGPWDMPGIPAPPGLEKVAHLRKVAPRLPRTLDGFNVAPDGGLRGVWQWIQNGQQLVRQPIPVESLAVFVNDREGADWAGQSILRSGYKHWLMLDMLYRASAVGAERQMMGVPVVTYPTTAGPGAQRKAEQIARAVRVGEDSGIGFEEGWTLALVGISGGTVDPLPLIKMHQQQLSKATMTMFLDLGHDAGARSLGTTFVQQLVNAQNTKRVDIQTDVTDHIIRDIVKYTFGPDEPWPALIGQEIFATDDAVLEQLGELANAGLLGEADTSTVNAMRRRVGLPPVVPGSQAQPTPGSGPEQQGITPPGGDVVPGTVITPGSPAVVGPAPTPGATAVTARPTARVGGVPGARQPAVAASAYPTSALSDLQATLGSVQQLMAALAGAAPSP